MCSVESNLPSVGCGKHGFSKFYDHDRQLAERTQARSIWPIESKTYIGDIRGQFDFSGKALPGGRKGVRLIEAKL